MGREPASGKTKGNGASRLSSHPRLTPLLARGQPSSLRSSFLRLSPHYAPQAGAPKGRYTIRSTKGQGTVADRVAGSALPSATRVVSDKGTSHRPSVSLLATVSSLTTHYASQTGASEVSASCRRPRPSAERSGNEVRDRQDAG